MPPVPSSNISSRVIRDSCEGCRRKKLKCSGPGPGGVCGRCQSRGTTCLFTAKKPMGRPPGRKETLITLGQAQYPHTSPTRTTSSRPSTGSSTMDNSYSPLTPEQLLQLLEIPTNDHTGASVGSTVRDDGLGWTSANVEDQGQFWTSWMHDSTGQTAFPSFDILSSTVWDPSTPTPQHSHDLIAATTVRESPQHPSSTPSSSRTFIDTPAKTCFCDHGGFAEALHAEMESYDLALREQTLDLSLLISSLLNLVQQASRRCTSSARCQTCRSSHSYPLIAYGSLSSLVAVLESSRSAIKSGNPKINPSQSALPSMTFGTYQPSSGIAWKLSVAAVKIELKALVEAVQEMIEAVRGGEGLVGRTFTGIELLVKAREKLDAVRIQITACLSLQQSSAHAMGRLLNSDDSDSG